jgi:hypothetical protein
METPSDQSMAEPAFTDRNSLIDRELTFRLGPEAITWLEGNRQIKIDYADVGSVKLVSYGSFGGMQTQCTLRAKPGGKLKLRSHSYVSLGLFEDRSEDFAAFVRELFRRIHAANSSAKFRAGSTGAWIVWLVLLVMMLGIFALVIASLLEGSSLPAGAMGSITALVIFLPLAWHLVRGGWGKNFDPGNPPPDTLGS